MENKLKVEIDGRVTYKIPSGKTIGKYHPTFYEKETAFYIKHEELLEFIKENKFYEMIEGEVKVLVYKE